MESTPAGFEVHGGTAGPAGGPPYGGRRKNIDPPYSHGARKISIDSFRAPQAGSQTIIDDN